MTVFALPEPTDTKTLIGSLTWALLYELRMQESMAALRGSRHFLPAARDGYLRTRDILMRPELSARDVDDVYKEMYAVLGKEHYHGLTLWSVLQQVDGWLATIAPRRYSGVDLQQVYFRPLVLWRRGLVQGLRITLERARLHPLVVRWMRPRHRQAAAASHAADGPSRSPQHINPVLPQSAATADARECLARFIGAFNLVFKEDWDYAREMLEKEMDYAVGSGNFLEPSGDWESRNWGSRAALLRAYKDLLAAMGRHGIEPRPPLNDGHFHYTWETT